MPDSHAGAMEGDHCWITGAGSLLFTVIPHPWSGITAIYGCPASLERDHWRSVTLRANKQYLTAPKNAGSLEIRNFEGEQAVPDSHAGALERDHCYLR